MNFTNITEQCEKYSNDSSRVRVWKETASYVYRAAEKRR